VTLRFFFFFLAFLLSLSLCLFVWSGSPAEASENASRTRLGQKERSYRFALRGGWQRFSRFLSLFRGRRVAPRLTPRSPSFPPRGERERANAERSFEPNPVLPLKRPQTRARARKATRKDRKKRERTKVVSLSTGSHESLRSSPVSVRASSARKEGMLLTTLRHACSRCTRERNLRSKV
jgi:hypothetical protein